MVAGSRITPARGFNRLGQPTPKTGASVTQKFMGANEMQQRLTAQVGNEAQAKRLLVQRGHMTEGGDWTKEGAKRNAMTAEERAIDRASTASGNAKRKYVYNPGTNRATMKR